MLRRFGVELHFNHRAGRQSQIPAGMTALMGASGSDIRSIDRHRGRCIVAPLAVDENDADAARLIGESRCPTARQRSIPP